MIENAIIATKAEKELSKSIDGLIDLAKSELKERFQKWKAKTEIDKIKENIRQVGKICTIASRQASTIDEIYYPARIKHGTGRKTIIYADELFPTNTRTALINGTAGQGKSVFLRYLCLRDVDYSGKIPLFIELRKIDKQVNLSSLIKSQLLLIGLEEDLIEPAADLLLKSGSMRLYLDGLDEIKREYALETKDHINALINKHPKLQIAITSRPGAISRNMFDIPHMQQYEIAPLTEKDHSGFFEKIDTPKETRIRLLAAIEKSSAQIKSLLSTPLMLTLLGITCGQKQDLPDTLPEFYDSLFNLLSSMHDGTKPGYIRQKATSLSNAELEKLFRAFSYASKETIGKISLNQSQFENALQDALKITDLKCTADGFRTDITETVCLMTKEGFDTTFSHKSIQEYYAASFIHRIEDDEVAKLVFSSIEGEKIITWINELRFLEDFQDLAYEKYVGIPHSESLAMLLYLPSRKIPTVSRVKIQSLFSDVDAKVVRTKITKINHAVYWTSPKKNSINRYLPDLILVISNEIKSYSKKPQSSMIPDDHLEFSSINTILKEDKILADRIYNIVQKFCDGLIQKSKKMKDRQSRQKKGLIDILSKNNKVFS